MITSRTLRFTLLCAGCAAASFLATVWSASPAAPPASATQPSAFFRWLDVSPAQQRDIQIDDPAFERDLDTLRSQVQGQRAALADLLNTPDAPDAQVLAQIDRLAESQRLLQRRIGEYLLRVRDHLTQPQRLQLMDLCAATLQPSVDAAPLGRGQGGAGRGMGYGRGRGGRGMGGPGAGGGGGGRGAGGGGGRAARAAATQQAATPLPGMGMQAHTAIEALFANHQKIERRIEEIPNGVRTFTTSSDPEVTRQLRLHLAQMKTRLEAGLPMRRFDPLFRELFANYQKIHMTIEEIPGGALVTETSPDPQVTLLIRQHARTVSEFAQQGISRMAVPSTLPAGYRPAATATQPSHEAH